MKTTQPCFAQAFAAVRKHLLILAAVFCAGAVRADFAVNEDLGALGFGTNALAGTTAGGPNNANQYTGQEPGFYWGSEYVYQFTLTQDSLLTLNTSDTDGTTLDNDFFLLDSLTTTPAGALQSATPLDFIYTSGVYGVWPAGTYYLVVDAYAAANSASAGRAGAFSASLIVSVPPDPPAAIAAVTGGSVSAPLDPGETLWFVFTHAGGPLTLDTETSALGPNNDTELFLFNANGALVASNDDRDADFLSMLDFADLPAGSYYLAAGGYNMVGSNPWTITNTSQETGAITIRGLSTGSGGVTFAQWAAASGIPGALPGDDHDLDGYDNATEFALGLFPQQAGAQEPSGGFHAYPDGERLRLLFTRPLDRTGVTLTVQAGSDLTAWTDLATSVDSGPFIGVGFVSEDRAHPPDEPGLVEVRDIVTTASAPRRQIRVLVTLAP